MGVAIASFFAVFLLVLSGGVLIFYRETHSGAHQFRD